MFPRRAALRSSRPPIGEALADDAAKGIPGAVLIVATQRNSVVIAELELAYVAVQVLLLAVLIDALHAALKDRERTFNRVRVDGRVRIIDALAWAVASEAMRSERR